MNEFQQFETDVRHLLSLQGWRLTPERVLGHKKIDAYAEKRGDFGRLRRIAVECKAHSDPLTQRDVTNIYANDLPLLQERLVDELLLVTSAGLAPSAITYVHSATGFIHVTYAELLATLLDFSSYVEGLIAQYTADDVSSYYIQQDYYLDNSQHLLFRAENAILSWIETTNIVVPEIQTRQ